MNTDGRIGEIWRLDTKRAIDFGIDTLYDLFSISCQCPHRIVIPNKEIPPCLCKIFSALPFILRWEGRYVNHRAVTIR